ncbi:hypothetical protein [Collimonas silvisoli]|uniref:hypothetical protein n=1 Tax=Collimonas silvisoli TaxID=2825884 RepID=UPI001B8BC0B9|nr:hypothetical protein [Collimonas silvisoli]
MVPGIRWIQLEECGTDHNRIDSQLNESKGFLELNGAAWMSQFGTPSPPRFTKPLIIQGLFYLAHATGVPFTWEIDMKLPSYLALSRHGVFYFRLTYRIGFALKEKRFSLRTKNPQEARFKATCLSAIMLKNKSRGRHEMAEQDFNTAEIIASGGLPSDRNTCQPSTGCLISSIFLRFQEETKSSWSLGHFFNNRFIKRVGKSCLCPATT